MTTRILDLPLYQIEAIVGDDEDWIEAICFFDASGAPLELFGVDFSLDIGANPAAGALVTASTANGMLSLVLGADGTTLNTLSIAVPAAAKAGLPPHCVVNCLASADGHAVDVLVGALNVQRRVQP